MRARYAATRSREVTVPAPSAACSWGIVASTTSNARAGACARPSSPPPQNSRAPASTAISRTWFMAVSLVVEASAQAARERALRGSRGDDRLHAASGGGVRERLLDPGQREARGDQRLHAERGHQLQRALERAAPAEGAVDRDLAVVDVEEIERQGAALGIDADQLEHAGG